MMKDELVKYQERKRQIEAYRAELDGDMATVDSVMGSMVDHPYVKRSITICGRDVQREQYLQMKISTLRIQCNRVEIFVAGIEDELIRELLYWHYVKGLSWPKVRAKLRMRKVTKDALRIRTDRYLEKVLRRA